MITPNEHHSIFKFVDNKFSDWVSKNPNSPLQRGSFGNETGKDRYSFVVKKTVGHFSIDYIIIHRDDLSKPNESYLHEVVTLLHEIGHRISLENGTWIPKYGIATSIAGFNYFGGSTNSERFVDECFAWLYSVTTMMELPLPVWKKSILLPIIVKRLCRSLKGYWVGYKMIFDWRTFELSNA